jgi:hypothetical protein
MKTAMHNNLMQDEVVIASIQLYIEGERLETNILLWIIRKLVLNENSGGGIWLIEIIAGEGAYNRLIIWLEISPLCL